MSISSGEKHGPKHFSYREESTQKSQLTDIARNNACAEQIYQSITRKKNNERTCHLRKQDEPPKSRRPMAAYNPAEEVSSLLCWRKSIPKQHLMPARTCAASQPPTNKPKTCSLTSGTRIWYMSSQAPNRHRKTKLNGARTEPVKTKTR